MAVDQFKRKTHRVESKDKVLSVSIGSYPQWQSALDRCKSKIERETKCVSIE